MFCYRARKHVIPLRRAPASRLALRESERDWTRLKREQTAAPLDDLAGVKLVECGAKVVGRAVATQLGGLSKVSRKLLLRAEQSERTEQHARVAKQRRIARLPPENHGINQCVVGSRGD